MGVLLSYGASGGSSAADQLHAISSAIRSTLPWIHSRTGLSHFGSAFDSSRARTAVSSSGPSMNVMYSA